MEHYKLQSSSRTVLGKKTKRLRNEGIVPAVLFGAKIESQPIQIDARDLQKALHTAGSTALIDLYLNQEGEPHVVLARDIQRDILTGALQHVDFYQVQLDQKVKTMPHLEIIGEAPAVKLGGAILIHVLTQVEVECLPDDLIDSIEVDVSSLETLDDSITIADLNVPPSVTILADPGDVVVSVVAPRAILMEEEEEEEEEIGEFVLGQVEEVEPEEEE